MRHQLKLGLIGAGRIGRLHAEHVTSRILVAQLAMVADAFEEAARECAERYDIPAYTRDYHELLARPDISAVLICSAPIHTRISFRRRRRWASRFFARSRLTL